MDATRWERVQRLFHEALDRPESERGEFLRSEAAGDETVIDDVLSLLEEDGRGDSLLDRGAADVAHRLFEGRTPMLRAIGPYRTIRHLGQGGMGIVYLAVRDDHRRRVAIKVLRDAALSPDRRRLFQREQQVLAQLDHQSVARLYDADVLPDGTPYFVMEYVDGVPLTAYCESRQLSIRQRLRLFQEVCEAVQYAHRQAVVHRDLKPSNILVTDRGGEGKPTVKLLDFGIAKQIESLDAESSGPNTVIRPMTPAYAAPEQLRGGVVGVYTDVYALGVILYELLTGAHPFDLRGLTPGQVEGIILEHEPPPPSVVHAMGRAEGRAARAAPQATVWSDLDVLCMSAMHKDPQRRYPTVEALLRDLRHFFAGEPLDAQPDSFGYRGRKFVARNLRPLALAATGLTLIVGLTAYYTTTLAAARDAALLEASRAERIQRFMTGLFDGGGGPAGPADSLRVLTLLERGMQDANLLDGEPEVQTELYHTLGTLFRQLGDFDRADTLLVAALEGRRAIFGPQHPEVARSLVALGLLRMDQAELDEAELLVREALEVTGNTVVPQHPALIESITALGKVLGSRGDFQGAITVLEEAVRARTRAGPAGIELSESLGELANAHFYAGNYVVSDSLNTLLLAMDRRIFGMRHPSVANALTNLAASRFQLGFIEDAERLNRQALEIKLGYFGDDHPETAASMTALAQSLTYLDRYDEAMELLRPALAIRERVFGPNHPRVANVVNEVGTVSLLRWDLDEAEASFQRMLDIYHDAYGEDHYLIGIAHSNLASVYSRGGDAVRAEEALRSAIDLFARTLSEEHVNTAVGRIKLGQTLMTQERYREAEAELRTGHDVLAGEVSPSGYWLTTAREELAVVYAALGDTSRAEEFAELVTPAE